MAQGAPDRKDEQNAPRTKRGQKQVPQSFLARMRASWDDEFCAEHDGRIASFERLGLKLDDLEDYKQVLEPRKANYAKGALTLTTIVGGGVVLGPLAFLSAPAIAGALGGAGLLGAAGTGTAITALHGAALTNAALAAIGMGYGMAGGMVILTAAGTALGGYQGAAISNAYYSNIQNFDIIKVREGRGPAVICVNGFLCQSDPWTREWRDGIQHRFKNNPMYYVQWESKNLREIGDVFSKAAASTAADRIIGQLAKRGMRRAMNPLKWGSMLTGLAANPWHVSTVKAAETGVLLADMLARTKHKPGFILVGHSLGSRVIHYALQALSTKERRVVREAHLLGGAVEADVVAWKQASSAVEERVYNYHTKNDAVLTYLYQVAQRAFESEGPIGLQAIQVRNGKLKNFDASAFVGGHLGYKPALPALLEWSRTGVKPKARLTDAQCPYCNEDLSFRAVPGLREEFECGECGEAFDFQEPVA
jgi:pimeloyl-ACP methyl ester carboxylesterase